MLGNTSGAINNFVQSVQSLLGVRILVLGPLLLNLPIKLNEVVGFLDAFDDLFDDDRFPRGTERLEYFSSQIAPVVRFEEEGTGWENTILAPLTIAGDPLMVAIPPGVGISWFTSPPRLDKIKSRYLLIDRPTRQKLGRRRWLVYTGTTLLGDLYVNMYPGEAAPRAASTPSE